LNKSPDSLQSIFDHAFAGISRALETYTPLMTPREVGTITTVSIGIAKVSGLPGVGYDELVRFPGDLYGIAFNVDEEEIGVVLLGDCGISTPAMRSNERVVSWTCRWAMD